MPARAWGTIRIVRASTNSTTTANTRTTISPATANLLVGNERGRALDLHHLDPRSLLVHLVLVVGARGPLLAADLHPAAPAIDALEDSGARPDQRGGPGADGGRRMEVPPRHRPDE